MNQYNLDYQLYLPTRDAWRRWLRKNRDKEKAVWLVYYKKHTGKPSIPYEDAVEEALCYGWIDSTVKKLDEERYQQKFTPRNLNSQWSDLNILRVKKLIKNGFMTKAGLDKIRPGILNKKTAANKIKPCLVIPVFIRKKLKSENVWERFDVLAPSHKRNYISWIMEGKKEETRIRRLNEAISLLKKNLKPGMR